MSDRRKKRATKAQRVELGFLEGLRRRCPESPKVLKPLGDLYTHVGRIREGLEVDRALTRLCPEDAMVWFNLGCSLALTDQPDEALGALSRAVDLGYDDADWMVSDEDLETVRDHPLFAEILARLKD